MRVDTGAIEPPIVPDLLRGRRSHAADLALRGIEKDLIFT